MASAGALVSDDLQFAVGLVGFAPTIGFEQKPFALALAGRNEPTMPYDDIVAADSPVRPSKARTYTSLLSPYRFGSDGSVVSSLANTPARVRRSQETEEQGLELSPTKINLIYTHLSPNSDVKFLSPGPNCEHSFEGVWRAGPGSPDSGVLSDMGEEQCRHNLLMGVKVLLILSTVGGFIGVWLLAQHRDASPFPFTRPVLDGLLQNIPVGFLFFFLADTIAYVIMREGDLAVEYPQQDECVHSYRHTPPPPAPAGPRAVRWACLCVRVCVCVRARAFAHLCTYARTYASTHEHPG